MRLGMPDGMCWPQNSSAWEDDRIVLQARCLAVYGLTLAGHNQDADLNTLDDQFETLGAFAQATLVRAMTTSPRFKTQVEAAMLHFEQGIKLNPQSGYYDLPSAGGWCYDSAARTTAVVLSAALESGHNTMAPPIMRWLLEHSRGGRWGTTQENAWILDAALTYVSRLERDTPHFAASVALDGLPFLQRRFDKRETTSVADTRALPEDRGGQVLPVALGMEGVGRLYYTLHMDYAPRDGRAWALDQGLSVDKVISALDNGRPVASLIAGHVYRVTLTVVSPQDRTWVVVDDPLCGGLEVVNTNFDTESDDLRARMSKIHKADEEKQTNPEIFGAPPRGCLR